MVRSLLIASDGSPDGLRAIRGGGLMARALGAEVRLLLVESLPACTWSIEFFSLLDHDFGPDLCSVLQSEASRLRAMGLQVTGRVVRGDFATRTAAEADSCRPDLLVVGDHRCSFLERWWLGPGAADLVDRVPCSVLVLRGSE